MSARTTSARGARLLGAGLPTLLAWAVAAGPVAAADRAETKGDAAPAPIAVTTATAAIALDAATPLPGGSVPWAAVAAPPAFGGAGGGMVLQSGGGAPQLRYYALDVLGSVRVVFDAAGAVVSRADNEPFGAPIPSSTTGTLPRQQYTGHERDGEVGVDYFGARMYVPQIGRMPSVDPLYVGAVEDPQRWNRYAYALNSPQVMVDPDGRCAKTPGVTFYTCTEVHEPTPTPGQPSLLGNGSGLTRSDNYFELQYGEVPNFGSQVLSSVHTALDVAGVVLPGLGDVADIVNAGLYALEGNLSDAATSGLAAVPVAGVGATVAKWGKSATKLVDPSTIRFSQDSIRSTFRNGQSLADITGALKGPGGATLGAQFNPIRLARIIHEVRPAAAGERVA